MVMVSTVMPAHYSEVQVVPSIMHAPFRPEVHRLGFVISVDTDRLHTAPDVENHHVFEARGNVEQTRCV